MAVDGFAVEAVQALDFAAQVLRAGIVDDNVISDRQALFAAGLRLEYALDLTFR